MASRVLTAAVLGGTISRISGGKFVNGAITAAYGQMFNAETENRGRVDAQKTVMSLYKYEMLENADGFYSEFSEEYPLEYTAWEEYSKNLVDDWGLPGS